jgi:hypothetical protein
MNGFNSGFGGFGGGFGGFGTSQRGSPTIEQLLQAAKMEGGAIAEVAHELTDPKASVLSTVGNGFKKAFKGFIDVMNVSSNTVAGVLSPDYTVGEAIKENITPSQVIFGDPVETDLFTVKALDWTGRFATDVLLDPLTYVTFGASAGALGIRSLPKVQVTKKMVDTATDVLSKTDDELIKQFGKNIDPASLRKQASYFKDRQVGEQIPVTNEAVKLAQKSLDNQYKGLRQTYLKDERIKIINAANAAKKTLPEEEIAKQLKKISDETSDTLIQETLGKKLSLSDTLATVSSLIKNNPALIETFIDKGGIKFFGKTILEGQRIRAVRNAIPGMSLLDNAIAPLKHKLNLAFNPDYIAPGFSSPEMIALKRALSESPRTQKGEFIQKIEQVVRKAQLTEQEVKLFTSAIQASKRPGDANLAALYDAVHGVEIYGPNLIRPELANAIRTFKQQVGINYKQIIQSGKTLHKKDNYFPNMFTKNKPATNYLGKNVAAPKNPSFTRQAEFNAFVDMQGNKILGFGKFSGKGSEQTLQLTIPKKGAEPEIINLTKVNKEKMANQVKDRVDEFLAKSFDNMDTLTSEILSLTKDIQKTFNKKTLAQFSKRISKMEGIDSTSKRILLNHINKHIPDVNVNNMITDVLSNKYSSGVKLAKIVSGLSDEAIEKLKSNLIKSNPADSPNIIRQFDEMVKQIYPKFKKGGEKYNTKDLKDVYKEIKDSFDTAQTDFLKASFGTQKNLTATLNIFKQLFEETKEGVGKQLEQIVSKKQNIRDILADVDLEKQIGKQQLKEIDKLTDDLLLDELTGKQFKRIQATTDESNKFFDAQDIDLRFETNALKIITKNTFDTINYTAQKDFLSDFAKIAGKRADDAPADWRALDLKELEQTQNSLANYLRNSNNEELVFHPMIAEWAEKAVIGIQKGDPTTEILESFDKLTNFFKASVTSIWPAFHGRNAISNVFLSMMDIGIHSLDPVKMVNAAKMNTLDKQLSMVENTINRGIFAPKGSTLYKKAIAAQDKMMEMNSKVFMKDKTGRTWTVGEMRAIMKKNVVAFQPEIGGAFDYSQVPEKAYANMYKHMFTPETKAGKIKKAIGKEINPMNPENMSIFRASRTIASAVEDQARTLHFLTYLQKTGDVNLAAQKTKQFLFDYSNVTDFERKVMKRIIPFYTFFRKNLEQQVKTLYQSPGRMGMQIKGVQTIGDVLESGRITEEERNNLPGWIQDGLTIATKRTGMNISVLGNIGTPIEAVFDIMQPSNMLGSVNPYLKLPVEWMSGYSFFYEKGIDEVNNAAAFKKAPPVLKDFIGFTEAEGKKKDGSTYKYYVSLRPERMYLITNLPGTSRVFSTFKSMEAADVTTQSIALQLLLGQRTYSFDLEVEAARREKELQRQLEQKLSQAGVGFTYQRYVLPKN